MKKVLYIILIVLIIIFCLLLYSRFIGTIGLETNEIPYKTEYIAESYNGLKIVHFSDLHYKKIDISDAIYVVNVDGYIGSSTGKEVEYAKKLGKEIMYLEPIK